MSSSPTFDTICLSSLIKVFADEEVGERPFLKGTALANETYSFQIAYRSDSLLKLIRTRVVSGLTARVSLRTVGLVTCEMPNYSDADQNVLRLAPGLYPDPLYPVTELDGLTAIPGQWRSLWVTVTLDGSVKPGTYPITIQFTANNGEPLGEETFGLKVLTAELPEQKLLHTEWFHADCLATYYGVDVFSEAHWTIVESFIATAVKHGINMILTPLFTPPLDTRIGGERPTTQLVDVTVEREGVYSFGFDRLKRWVEMCDRLGVQYFEFSHLFTQWGAKHAPKIVAQVDGSEQRIFGWDTDATGVAYKDFLAQFLPQLVGFIKENGLEKRSYFHVSDEPTTPHLPTYESASSWLSQFLGEFPVMDALSEYDFYERGLVKMPIPANNHIEPFLEHEVPGLWTYYCCAQHQDVSNRFICMPSARNRVLALQLYKFNIAGFLHWGYNFYYSQYSRYPIDPYRVTDAGHAFPSGDPFVVYPGADGQPVESIRLEVFYEALQDLRALEKLESLIGRERVLALLEEGLERPITFSEYPHDASWLLEKRAQVNALIESESLAQAEATPTA
ncbi:DUF4091 domain-containing protein [Paenibacillus koleovorans]|uniref:DUF4091 domain-containing protein n=1 Tax=Paenibacillus koleovorans TaxID=121608 RepID=UPI000FD85EF3|nr:DUF4091 domain-containing protein [Paenibacillus koleovorans]